MINSKVKKHKEGVGEKFSHYSYFADRLHRIVTHSAYLGDVHFAKAGG